MRQKTSKVELPIWVYEGQVVPSTAKFVNEVLPNLHLPSLGITFPSAPVFETEEGLAQMTYGLGDQVPFRKGSPHFTGVSAVLPSRQSEIVPLIQPLDSDPTSYVVFPLPTDYFRRAWAIRLFPQFTLPSIRKIREEYDNSERSVPFVIGGVQDQNMRVTVPRVQRRPGATFKVEVLG